MHKLSHWIVYALIFTGVVVSFGWMQGCSPGGLYGVNQPEKNIKFKTPTTQEMENMSQNKRRQFLRQKARRNIRYEKSKENPDRKSIDYWQGMLEKMSQDTATVEIKETRELDG